MSGEAGSFAQINVSDRDHVPIETINLGKKQAWFGYKNLIGLCYRVALNTTHESQACGESARLAASKHKFRASMLFMTALWLWYPVTLTTGAGLPIVFRKGNLLLCPHVQSKVRVIGIALIIPCRSSWSLLYQRRLVNRKHKPD